MSRFSSFAERKVGLMLAGVIVPSYRRGTPSAHHTGVMVQTGRADYVTTIHLSNGERLQTKHPPEEWSALFARAAATKHQNDTAWITLHDDRKVLVQLHHVALIEPPADWHPSGEPQLSEQSRATDADFGPIFSPE